jgi:DivIVA domain-containing protein
MRSAVTLSRDEFGGSSRARPAPREGGETYLATRATAHRAARLGPDHACSIHDRRYLSSGEPAVRAGGGDRPPGVGGGRRRGHTPRVVEKYRDRADERAGERPAPSPGGPARSQPVVANEIRDVSFPTAVRGYDRRKVDRYVQRVNRAIAELEVSRSPESAVRHALDRVGEQTSGILQRARETAEEITHSARAEAEETTARARAEANEIIAHARAAAERIVAEAEKEAAGRVKQGEAELDALRKQGDAARADAEETTARAKAEGSEIVAEAKSEAEQIVARANSEASQRLEREEQQREALRTRAEAAMRGLRADTDTIEEERRHLFEEIHGLATRLEELVSPPEESAEPAPGEPKAAAGDPQGPKGDAVREDRT